MRVGVARPQAIRRQRPKLALAAVCPVDAPWLCERYPGFKIKNTRFPSGDGAVEHLRLPRGADLSGLPGLDGSQPSLLRDSVRLAFNANVDVLDIVVARSRGKLPWDLGSPEIRQLLQPFLSELSGLVIAFPDAVGRPQLGTLETPVPERLMSLVSTVVEWGPFLREHYQVGFADLPPDGGSDLFDALRVMRDNDFVLAGWEGEGAGLERHGWRSASTLLAALVTRTALPTQSVSGQRVSIADGRRVALGRHRELGQIPERRQPPEHIEHAAARLVVRRTGTEVDVWTEGSLRAPAGAWSIPMLRTAKLVHQRLMIAANQFVFRPATPETALTLQNALRLALQDYEARNIVGGEKEGEPSMVLAQVIPSRPTPMLSANVTCFLRPWLKKVNVDITVRPGESPVMRVI